MAPHLGLQRIMIPSAQVSSLTTGSITLPSAKGAFAGNNYESISTVTLSSGSQSTITFSSIPTTYKNLQIRCHSKSTVNGTSENAYIRFNGDTTSGNYFSHYFTGNGSSAGGGAVTSNGTFIYVNALPGNTNSAWDGTYIDIADYQSTTKKKTIKSHGGWAISTAGFWGLWSGHWSSTAAITSITLNCSTGNFAQYSHFALYGIKGA